jgi:hypothetical protein
MAVRSLKNSTLENFSNYSSSMNAGYDFNDFELIESVFVASPASSITFNNLNQYATEYKHLQIRATARISGATTAATLVHRLNGDTASNYSSHELVGNGSAVSSASFLTDRAFFGVAPGGSSTANAFGAMVFDLLDPFSVTKNKTSRILGGQTSNNFIYLYSASHRSTASITSIQIYDNGGTNFVAGSRFSLYGIR